MRLAEKALTNDFMEAPLITAVIVTYNSAECVGACIASLRMQRGVVTRIVVVDNVSRDDTVRRVRELSAGI